MKKSSFFILLSMMALTCEFGLTACSSANEEWLTTRIMTR